MDRTGPLRIPVTNGAEAFLELIRANEGVRYIFANTGTDHGPIIEALAKAEKHGQSSLKVITVPHELAAVSMAHGHYNVTRQAQVVLVHTLPGTANALGGVINACSSNVPVILVAGRTPVTEGELSGGKSRNIHWRQESRDQAAILREFVKWDFELRSTAHISSIVPRAFKIAQAEPRGPVYLTLPREWLCESMHAVSISCEGFKSPAPPQADSEALEQAADLLVDAVSPLIVTKYLGRNPQAVRHLVELSELLSIPVVQQPSYMNFPTNHPLYLGVHALKYAKQSDVIFLIDVDIPWNNPSREILRPDAKLIHLEVDPAFTSIPTWGFQIDLAITGCSERSLPALNAILREKVKQRSDAKAVIEERRKQVEKQHIVMRKELEAKMDAAKKEKPIHPLWLSKCISNLMDEQTILINETVTSPLQEVLDVGIPGSVFNTPPAGHLGWGLGAAIGTKLGAPEKTVIAALGDGAYIFSSPLACHFVANKYDIPFLAIIYNNQAWNASINTALELYPDGVARQTRNFPGTDLRPSPRFELVAEACGGYSERVEEPEKVEAALKRALQVVHKERRQAVVNVICACPL